MRKFLLGLALFVSHAAFSQLVAFDFAKKLDQSDFVEEGILPAPFSYSGMDRSVSGGVVTFSKITNSVTPADDYIEFTITPAANYSLTFLSIQVKNVRRSEKGPKKLQLRSSLNNFASSLGETPANNLVEETAKNFTFQLVPAIANATTPITFRVYAYAAENSGANSQLVIGGTGDEIVVNGIEPISLPVNFANVKATKKAGGVDVAFSNLTEEDVAVYHVERSTNGVQYQSIATIAPRANNNSRADYQYTDKTPVSGNNYYRIRAVETTGKQVFSAVVKVGVEGSAASMLLYPNPASKSSGINLQLANLPAGAYSIRLFNSNGQVIGTKQLQHNGGSISESLPLNGAAAGRYVVDVKGAVQFTQSFLLQ